MPSKRPYIPIRLDEPVYRAYKRFSNRTRIPMQRVIEGVLIDFMPLLADLQKLVVQARDEDEERQNELLLAYAKRTRRRVLHLAWDFADKRPHASQEWLQEALSEEVEQT